MCSNWVDGIDSHSFGPDLLRLIIAFNLVDQKIDKLMIVARKFMSDVENDWDETLKELLFARKLLWLEWGDKFVGDESERLIKNVIGAIYHNFG